MTSRRLAMTNRITINYAELGAMADRSSEMTNDLDAVGNPSDADFSHSPRTRHGYHEFEQAWDKKRGELVEALRVVTEALAGISEVFEEADRQMTEALEGGA